MPAALATPAAKSAAARAHSAIAADMESAAIARAAARGRARFVALRVVVDALNDSLPRDVESWIDERGERRIATVLGAALRPSQWRLLWILGLRYRVARRVLDRVAALLAAQQFCAAGAAR